MAFRSGRRALVLGLALMIGACKKDETFDGSYQGDGIDSQSASNVKQFTLRLSASGSTVSGSYELKAVILNVSGAVTGTMSGSNLDLTLTPAAGITDCPYRITATWQGGRITGSYAAFNCFVRSDGSLNLKKQ